jgi:hypothetical protein
MSEPWCRKEKQEDGLPLPWSLPLRVPGQAPPSSPLRSREKHLVRILPTQKNPVKFGEKQEPRSGVWFHKTQEVTACLAMPDSAPSTLAVDLHVKYIQSLDTVRSHLFQDYLYMY